MRERASATTRALLYMTTWNLKQSVVLALAVLAISLAQSKWQGLTADESEARVSFSRDHAESDFLNAGVASVSPGATEVASLTTGAVRDAAGDGAKALMRRFQAMGYELDMIRAGNQPVPRVFLARLPGDLGAVRQVDLKKSVFFKTTLPLILKENERILNDRRRLLDLKNKTDRGQTIETNDDDWLTRLYRRYKTDEGDLTTLVTRVDIIPVSLAMAQAAEESGWGTSRFAQRGNALFGQWTTADDEGLVPKDRAEGKTHKVKKFDTLAASVAGYMRNLNTHGAYKSLRAERARMRRAGQSLDGHRLAGTLTKYSERGQKYVDSIRLMIDANDLRALDQAELRATESEEQSA